MSDEFACLVSLNLIWVGFLGVRFEVEGGGKTTPNPPLTPATHPLSKTH